MKVLKGFALGLLGFILFLSLTALGLAIMLNSTVLNADFVVSEVNKVDISSLANDYINQVPPDQLPQR